MPTLEQGRDDNESPEDGQDDPKEVGQDDEQSETEQDEEAEHSQSECDEVRVPLIAQEASNLL